MRIQPDEIFGKDTLLVAFLLLLAGNLFRGF
jgi:hypothetical protein